MDCDKSSQKSSAPSYKRKGKQCAAFGCSNKFYGAGGLPSPLHFFHFPKDPKKSRWCNLIKRQHGKDGFSVTNSTVVCSEHFRNEDVHKSLTGRWILVSGTCRQTFVYFCSAVLNRYVLNPCTLMHR